MVGILNAVRRLDDKVSVVGGGGVDLMGVGVSDYLCGRTLNDDPRWHRDLEKERKREQVKRGRYECGGVKENQFV